MAHPWCNVSLSTLKVQEGAPYEGQWRLSDEPRRRMYSDDLSDSLDSPLLTPQLTPYLAMPHPWTPSSDSRTLVSFDSSSNREGVKSAYSSVSGLTEFSEQSLLSDAAYGGIARDERLSSGSSASSSWSGGRGRLERSSRQSLGPLSSTLSLQHDPHKAEAARLFKGKAYHEAIQVLSEAVSANPSDPSYFYNRSVCFSQVNDHHRAHMDAETALALALDPSSGNVKTHLEALGSKVLLQLARTEMRLQLFDRAFLTLQRARHLNETTVLKPTVDRKESMNCSVRITDLLQELRRQQAEQSRSVITPSKYIFRRAAPASSAAQASPQRRVVLSPIAAGSPEKVAFPSYGSINDETQTRIWRYRNAMRMKEELRLLPPDSNDKAQAKYLALVQLLGSQMVPQAQLQSRQAADVPTGTGVEVVAAAEAEEESDSDLQSISSVSSVGSLLPPSKQSSLTRARGAGRARKKVLFAED